jgi:hypothetical protein
LADRRDWRAIHADSVVAVIFRFLSGHGLQETMKLDEWTWLFISFALGWVALAVVMLVARIRAKAGDSSGAMTPQSSA